MKDTKKNVINLIFSAFLVIGYIVCTYFFSNLANQVSGIGGNLILVAILLIFGMLLFYATRVGDGKQVKRFSLPVLLLLDIPCIYIIAASLVEFLPLHKQLAPVDPKLLTTLSQSGVPTLILPIIVMLAAIALGYGIPYTFLSGYELKADEEEEEAPEEEEAAEDEAEAPATEKEDEPIEGGIAEELAEAEKAAEAEEPAAAEGDSITELTIDANADDDDEE